MFNNCIKIPHDWQHKQRCSHRILPRDLCRALRSAYSFSSVNCRRCSSCTDIATMQPHSPDSSHLTVSVILLAGCREAASASISVTQWPTISILHPVGKNYTLERKLICTFQNGHDVMYRHAKFGVRSNNVRRL